MQKSQEKWAEVVSRAVGCSPKDLQKRTVVAVHAKSVWYGLMSEFRPKIALTEMMALGQSGSNAHTSAHAAVCRWRELPWRERYGWLLLADSLYGSGDRRGEWSISETTDESLLDAVRWRRRHHEDAKPEFEKIRIPGHYDER